MSFNKKRYFFISCTLFVAFLLSILIPVLLYEGIGLRMENFSIYFMYALVIPKIPLAFISEDLVTAFYHDGEGFYIPKGFWGYSFVIFFWAFLFSILATLFSFSSNNKSN